MQLLSNSMHYIHLGKLDSLYSLPDNASHLSLRALSSMQEQVARVTSHEI